MDLSFLIALAVGTCVMVAVLIICKKWVSIPLWKTIVFAVLLTICGLISVKLMYFVENGRFDGQSFFGAVLFVPLFLFPVSLIIREPWQKLNDCSAPAICGMLAMMKIECLRTGCCAGKALYTYYKDGDTFPTAVTFPSQIVEMSTAVVIMVALIFVVRSRKCDSIVYPIFMIVYSTTRFVLNYFRATIPFVLGMPAGNFWSIVAVVIGIVWLVIHHLYKNKKTKLQTA